MADTDLPDFINNPGEGNATEVKRWIDPAALKGKVHLIRTLIALLDTPHG
jgi:hypothetical protein